MLFTIQSPRSISDSYNYSPGLQIFRTTTNRIEGLNGYFKKLVNRCTRMDDLVCKLLAAAERKVWNLRRGVFNERAREN